MNPLQPVARQGQRREEWRAGRQRMNGRPEIVEEAWNCQLERTCRAAGLRLSFEHLHLESGLSKNNSCGESVGPCSDYTGSAAHQEICFRRSSRVRTLLTFSSSSSGTNVMRSFLRLIPWATTPLAIPRP